jgi:hypothetical protein
MAGVLANAQSTGRANLTGVVTDTKGSVIVGAQITVTNIGDQRLFGLRDQWHGLLRDR